eukprot:3923055-Alexandrium_andersonii.AAC.1
MESLEALLLAATPRVLLAAASPTAAPAGAGDGGSTSAEGTCTPTLRVLCAPAASVLFCRRG